MSGDFDRACDIVIVSEGGYVNDPNDPGGETKFGISKRAYPDKDIAALTYEDAKAIYATDYWLRANCQKLAWPMSLYVFDCAVNQGVGTAVGLSQRAADPMAFLAERALRYANSTNFDRYGRGWMRRLFNLTQKAAS